MTNLTIVRPHISTYLADNYRSQEKSFCKELGFLYSDKVPEQDDYILITDTHIRLESLEPDQLQRLKLILHPNSGFDNLNLDLMKSYTIPVLIGNPIRANAVAEYVLSCLLSYFSTPRFQAKWNYKRTWERPLLKELNILLIGHGHIGSIINNSLSALGCEILVYDPCPKFSVESGKNIDIDEYDLAGVDVVILSASLNKGAKPVVDKNFLNQLHERVMIINPARAGFIDTNSLFDFLRLNPKATAFIDVLDEEPPTNDILEKIERLRNFQLSSHIAGVYQNISQAMLDFEKETLSDFKKLSLEDFLRKYQKLTI